MPDMNTYERALQIHQVLVSAAHNRQTLTYSLLGKAVGLPARSLGHHLLHITNSREPTRPAGCWLSAILGLTRPAAHPGAVS